MIGVSTTLLRCTSPDPSGQERLAQCRVLKGAKLGDTGAARDVAHSIVKVKLLSDASFPTVVAFADI